MPGRPGIAFVDFENEMQVRDPAKVQILLAVHMPLVLGGGTFFLPWLSRAIGRPRQQLTWVGQAGLSCSPLNYASMAPG